MDHRAREAQFVAEEGAVHRRLLQLIAVEDRPALAARGLVQLSENVFARLGERLVVADGAKQALDERLPDLPVVEAVNGIVLLDFVF